MIEQKLHEECGVFGIYSERDDQRRGQQRIPMRSTPCSTAARMSCGIAVNDDGVIKCYKDDGPRAAKSSRAMCWNSLGDGHIAVGHVRYGTSGNADRANAQPMVVRHVQAATSPCAHNGQLTNAQELRRELELSGAIFHTTNDYRGHRLRHHARAPEDRLHRRRRVAETMKQLSGAYSHGHDERQEAHRLRATRTASARCASASCERPDHLRLGELRALDASAPRSCATSSPARSSWLSEKGLDSIRAHCGQTERPVRL